MSTEEDRDDEPEHDDCDCVGVKELDSEGRTLKCETCLRVTIPEEP
jgi:hypothetical protein